MKYNPLKYYKKFKRDYKEFVVFVKCGEYYYTYDADAKIVSYIFDGSNPQNYVRVKKDNFTKVVKVLLRNNLNVVLVGSKNTREYYTDTMSKYRSIKNKSRLYFKGSPQSSEAKL